MKRTLKYWLIAAILLLPMSLSAVQVTPPEAQEMAQRFLARHDARSLKAPVATMTLAHAEPSALNAGLADYYIFNAQDGASFVIIAGDDRAEEILGYGDGTIDVNRLPCNLRWLLDMYKEQIEFLHAHPALMVEQETPQLKVPVVDYLPLLTCDWSQGTPYNDQCPVYGDEHCVTGCVATAMAQVMYYWRYPQSCASIAGYSLGKMSLPALPATTFNWNAMIDSYLGNYTEVQGAAVAKLMRYCGQSCKMDYGVDGSGSTVANQLSGMRQMGYSRSAYMVERANYDGAQWLTMMLQDLAQGRPILYSGSGMDGGHAFVVDGYDAGMNKFHINWGWASVGNGYFSLGAFNVLDYSFNTQQQMLVNIYPSTTPVPDTRNDFAVDGIYYRYIEDAATATVTCKDTHYNSYHGAVTVPETVTYNGNTLTVTAVGMDAFRNCDDLTSVTLPATITTIGQHAFRSAFSLQEVNLPDGLQVIENQAFANCVSLSAIDLPKSLRQIGNNVFFNCKGLTRLEIDDLQSWIDLDLKDYYSSPLVYAHRLYVNGQEITHLVIPDGTPSIPNYRFAGFKAMTALTLPSGLVSIGASAFSGCSALNTVEFPSSLQVMKQDAFKGCSGLTQLQLPPSLQSIGAEAFYGCTALASISLTGPVGKIGLDAFKKCTALQRVSIPDLETWMGCGFVNEYSNPLFLAQHLFVGNSEVTAIIIPATTRAIGDYAFYGFAAAASLTLGKRVTTIGKNAFTLCKGLKQIVIGDEVTAIGEKAFSTCSGLESLTIGARVDSIGDKAFIACTNLNEVICRATVPPVAVNVMWFSNATCSNAVLKVPKAAVEAYKKAAEWKRFSQIVGVDLHDVIGDVNGDGEIGIADVNALVSLILTDGAAPASGDVNGDGEISVADVNALIDLILTMSI